MTTETVTVVCPACSHDHTVDLWPQQPANWYGDPGPWVIFWCREAGREAAIHADDLPS